MLVNGDVFTGRGHARALAIRGDAIVTVGDDAVSYAGPDTRVLDLEGKSVVLGLTDAHCHLYGLGLDLESVSVRGLDSEVAVANRVAAAARTRPADEWLLGRGWDQNLWPGQQFPTKASLDAAVADRPVLLRRIDGHAAWVNSRALAEAGITKATRDPAGGTIVRDQRGEPTGVLIDNAIELVERTLPPASAEARERRILAAARVATELGFTAVHEMGIDDATAGVYRELAAAGRLPLRVYAYLAGTPARAEELRTRHPEPAVGRFVMRGVKYFADGALGSRGARLHAPYADAKDTQGLWVTDPATLTSAVQAAAAGGWDVAVHAIGDAGIAAVLDAYAAVRKNVGATPRLRVEHVQVIAEPDVRRMYELGAIASMQPTHATSDMPWAEARVGSERIQRAYAWRTMLQANIPLAFGSDFPVEQVDPLLGLHAAVTRTSPAGEPAGGWYPEQKVTLDEALHAFTDGGAAAAGIVRGDAADLTVFDGPLAEATLLERRAVMTIVGGDVVYEMPGAVVERRGS